MRYRMISLFLFRLRGQACWYDYSSYSEEGGTIWPNKAHTTCTRLVIHFCPRLLETEEKETLPRTTRIIMVLLIAVLM